jgi:A/G-specific adenine glycosylase
MKRIVKILSSIHSSDSPQGRHKDQSNSGHDEKSFSDAVIAWQKTHGRHALPWQNTRDAYRIWVSEIMLQQTQVATVIPYYERFMSRFPDVQSLAAARSEDVMAHWSGLGYYSRARNLHRCAQRVVGEYGGLFPSDPELLADLPGIGRSTAAAISAFAYGTRAAILDGNVKRVFCRVFGIDGYPGEKKVELALWARAESLLPEVDMTAYTQGLMDLGATICVRNTPACQRCPLAGRCIAFSAGRIAELPVRKPKKAVPEKHVSMLVIVHDNQVLLEQRAGLGIWGGLLSLPQLSDMKAGAPDSTGVDADTEAAIADFVAPLANMASYRALPSLTHTFTHFKLHIAPFVVQISRRKKVTAQNAYVWHPIDKLENAPLPAPIKKLLTGLFVQDDLLAGLN